MTSTTTNTFMNKLKPKGNHTVNSLGNEFFHRMVPLLNSGISIIDFVIVVVAILGFFTFLFSSSGESVTRRRISIAMMIGAVIAYLILHIMILFSGSQLILDSTVIGWLCVFVPVFMTVMVLAPMKLMESLARQAIGRMGSYENLIRNSIKTRQSIYVVVIALCSIAVLAVIIGRGLIF